MCVVYGWISVNQHLEVNMSNNKQIEKPLELPHQETIVGTNTIQTKLFDNQKTMSNNKQPTAVDSIIELCQKQMDSEIHLKTTLLMMTNKTQQTAVKLLRLKEQLDRNPWQYNWIIEEIDEIIDALNNEEYDDHKQQ